MKLENPEVGRFETSVFDGQYITGDVDQHYLDRVNNARSDNAKKSSGKKAELNNIDMHNIDQE